MQCKGETMSEDIKEKTMALIDSLKSTCQSYGMGNDGNEYKVITQVFLYKFLMINLVMRSKKSVLNLLMLINGKLYIGICLK